MTIDEAIELMKNEKACILKADTCDRDCAKCELLRKTEDLLSAYDMAIKALEQEPCEDAISRKAVLCHNENHDYAECDQFVCSNCGIELQDWLRVERDEDDGDITYHPYEFNYCPNCGAKIDKRTLKYADQDTLMSAT